MCRRRITRRIEQVFGQLRSVIDLNQYLEAEGVARGLLRRITPLDGTRPLPPRHRARGVGAHGSSRVEREYKVGWVMTAVVGRGAKSSSRIAARVAGAHCRAQYAVVRLMWKS
jgi:hypothetical protein